MYYFYINFPNFKDRTILIHNGDCGNCQNGIGMNDIGSNERGFWAGPFKDLNQAEQALQSLIKLFNHKPMTGNHTSCN
jgi:hypothetical protein